MMQPILPAPLQEPKLIKNTARLIRVGMLAGSLFMTPAAVIQSTQPSQATPADRVEILNPSSQTPMADDRLVSQNIDAPIGVNTKAETLHLEENAKQTEAVQPSRRNWFFRLFPQTNDQIFRTFIVRDLLKLLVIFVYGGHLNSKFIRELLISLDGSSTPETLKEREKELGNLVKNLKHKPSDTKERQELLEMLTRWNKDLKPEDLEFMRDFLLDQKKKVSI